MSKDLLDAFQSEMLTFNGAEAKNANANESVPIYSPVSYSHGNSISHLDEVFNHTPHSLMTQSLNTGDVISRFSYGHAYPAPQLLAVSRKNIDRGYVLLFWNLRPRAC